MQNRMGGGTSQMRKRDEIVSGCMSKAHDGEMTFVLLGRDASAPETIRFWIEHRIRTGQNKPGAPKLAEAENCARVMEMERGDYQMGRNADDLAREIRHRTTT